MEPKRPRNDSNPSLRAAQYVRMSTEHQKYSTDNQAVVIRKYAEQRGFDIVRVYADEGKSGLRLDGRDALKRLIDDVSAREVDFGHILVYDVSRWGRFQDADESAYYEFICKEAGISVHYCAEQFENDGSLSATIIKGMKRAMAGEYSRELSAKVFAGQCRLISLGYRQGGTAGFGLRRLLVDEHRQPKAELTIGERKSLQSDRVVLVPGPQSEMTTVRRMYRMFVDQGKREAEIARALNAEGLVTDLGRRWTRATVHQVLTNEKYIGNNVYNHISFKLKKKRVENPPNMWIRAASVFDAVVSPEQFYAARSLIEARRRHISDTELLEGLKRLLSAKGYLSGLVIDEAENIPLSATYRHRFGTLLRAYELIGYDPGRDYRYVETNRFLRALYPGIVQQTIAELEKVGARTVRHPNTDLFTISEEFSVSIVIAKCLRTSAGRLRWKIRFDTALRPDITIAVRMNEANEAALDYYLLPFVEMQMPKLRLNEENGMFLDSYRSDSLHSFFYLAERVTLRAAA